MAGWRMIGLKTIDEHWVAENVVAQELVRGLELPASIMRTDEQHARLIDKVFRELKEHPYGTYGSLGHNEIDWQLRYAGWLLPPAPRPVKTQSK